MRDYVIQLRNTYLFLSCRQRQTSRSETRPAELPNSVNFNWVSKSGVFWLVTAEWISRIGANKYGIRFSRTDSSAFWTRPWNSAITPISWRRCKKAGKSSSFWVFSAILEESSKDVRRILKIEWKTNFDFEKFYLRVFRFFLTVVRISWIWYPIWIERASWINRIPYGPKSSASALNSRNNILHCARSVLRVCELYNEGVTQVGRFKMDERADGTLAIGIFFGSPFRAQSHIPVDKWISIGWVNYSISHLTK